ncbi:DUF979 domain-containing protein [Arenimonas donghaensis]|uniref:Permease n=1 Tax=Arenimonas donghaensis DSM 18148 = HO3-R19 TaxID=1121014 RepID=A0A087MKI9_9GAMM|nr:DUF979 domain-containing protein [Arenimonas donghaensis]KFL37392.1 hypothetical protein N788_09355 [Arenimonas donghaensis DSM 18148 = HO3-R19]
MITLQYIYWLAGAYLLVLAWRGGRDRSNRKRWGNAGFWGIMALMFLAGERLPSALAGAAVLALALIAGLGAMGRGGAPQARDDRKREQARALGNRLFLPALLIPGTTVALVLAAKYTGWGSWLLAADQTTVIALGLACLASVLSACLLTRRSPMYAIESSRPLVDAIGWTAILPLMLAALGSVFAATGVGDAVSSLVQWAIPVENRLAVVLAYALGMALFTMVMGNAFAAFPVMTAGIGIPLLVQGHGAEAASMAAIGMLSGYCGTLMTPMAANFNLVPVALLELDDPYAVIRAQLPTALPLLAANVVLMYLVIFR